MVSFDHGEDSTAVLSGLTIINGWNQEGGGIYCSNSSPILLNTIIISNTASNAGGGIYCGDSDPKIINVTIKGNTAGVGGGIASEASEYRFKPSLANVTITGNNAVFGGGIYHASIGLIFDPENRSNIYLNYAILSGNDIYGHAWPKHFVFVDTFTVLNPTDYHVFPANNFVFDILHAKIEQVEADLYVSPDGDDANSGQSPSEPLQTISFALSKILANSVNPHTIYLSEGKYSPSTTGEDFPVNMVSHVSLSGESEKTVILDAAGRTRVMNFERAKGVKVENMTLTGGVTTKGGGISCFDANPILMNVTITGNSANSDFNPSGVGSYGVGGGIYCWFNSSPILQNVTIKENIAEWGGGIYSGKSRLSLMNSTVSENTASKGGGIHSIESKINLINVTMSENEADMGGGIYSEDSHQFLVNTILWNDSPQEMYFAPELPWSDPSSIVVAYSDVQGDSTGIETNDFGSIYWLQGNISTDPLFVDLGDGNFHLQEGSPCIDAGTAFYVWEGDTLVNVSSQDYVGSAPDLGAFEYGAISITQEAPQIPLKFTLNQPYPNPFNPTTTLEFSIPQTGVVTLTVYDLLGREAETILSRSLDVGHHTVQWNASNVPSGIYFVRMHAGDFTQTRKMLLLH